MTEKKGLVVLKGRQKNMKNFPKDLILELKYLSQASLFSDFSDPRIYISIDHLGFQNFSWKCVKTIVIKISVAFKILLS